VEWECQAKLVDIVGESEDRFGNPEAIHRNAIIVAARGDDAHRAKLLASEDDAAGE
jgi:hypothetical protein